MLLINVRGPTSFENLRTVDGQICATYREACQKLQLLENDDHWETTLAEASATRHPRQLRALFAIILVTCSPSNPKLLWDKFKEDMAEDILHQHRADNNDPAMEYSDTIFNECLILLEDRCMEIKNKLLIEVGMIAPIRPISDPYERDLIRETDYHPQELEIYLGENLPKLQPEQKNVYDYVMDAIINQTGGLHFIDAPGGTGKTFLISLILASVRSQGNIALAIASSGIAATLLDGGRTAHSALKLPLKWQFSEDYTCNITKNSSIGKVLQTCKIIVWDECTMAHKKSLEALHRTLQDLRNNTNLFGGALILLAGDFRQTLPVIPGSTPADELNACLKSSSLWSHVKTLKLTTNMRVALQNDTSALQFSKQLLDLGNGKIPVNPATNCITFPPDFCKLTQSIEDLIISIFPNIDRNFTNTQWLCERALLAAKNVDVNYINNIILNRIGGSIKTYNSIDTVMEENDVVNYPIEFLNSLDLPGFPPHVLQLKIGVPIVLLRNIDPPKLCNGTRLAVKKLHNNIIEATIITGKYKGEN
ncbi:ATP-dependent DNA helicase pif1-like, partial [Musca vetustissima]|uniref:ATP-dependent DNA helicase pif1-like n=1 Tax=Musca vetustissima TaxID=27455 RepID=UPI002AB71A53